MAITPQRFDISKFNLDVKLEAISNLDETRRDFVGKKTFSSSMFKEGKGFGITRISIVTNPSLQPIVEITFKDLYGNLAFGSQTILYDKQLILKYIGILKNLKYVIISLDYPSLYWGFSKDRDFFYYHYYGINIRNKSYFKENFSYFFYVYSPKTSVEILMNNNKLKLVFFRLIIL